MHLNFWDLQKSANHLHEQHNEMDFSWLCTKTQHPLIWSGGGAVVQSHRKWQETISADIFPTGGNWVELENYKVRRIKTSNLDKLDCFQMGLGGGRRLPGNYLWILWPLLYQCVRQNKPAKLVSAVFHLQLLYSYKCFFLFLFQSSIDWSRLCNTGCYDNSSSK